MTVPQTQAGVGPASPTTPMTRRDSVRVNYTTIDITMTEALAKVTRERSAQDQNNIFFRDLKESLVFT